jgi:hypothetical protein
VDQAGLIAVDGTPGGIDDRLGDAAGMGAGETENLVAELFLRHDLVEQVWPVE